MLKRLVLISILSLTYLFSYEISDLKSDENSFEIIKNEKNSEKLLEIFNKTDLDILKSKVLLNEYIPVELVYRVIQNNNARLKDSVKQNILYKILTSKDKEFLEKQLTSKNKSIVFASKLALKNLPTKEETSNKIPKNLTKDYISKVTDPGILEEIYFNINPADYIKEAIILNPYLSERIYKDATKTFYAEGSIQSELVNRKRYWLAAKTTLHKILNDRDIKIIEENLNSSNPSLKKASIEQLKIVLTYSDNKDFTKKYLNTDYKHFLIVNENIGKEKTINLLRTIKKDDIFYLIKNHTHKFKEKKYALEWLFNHDDKDISDIKGSYLPNLVVSHIDLYMKIFDEDNEKNYDFNKWTYFSNMSMFRYEKNLAEKYILNSDNYIEKLTMKDVNPIIFANIVETYMSKNNLSVDEKIEFFSKIAPYEKSNIQNLYNRYVSSKVSEASISNRKWLETVLKDSSKISYSFTESMYAFFILNIIGNIILLILISFSIFIYLRAKKLKALKIVYIQKRDEITKEVQNSIDAYAFLLNEINDYLVLTIFKEFKENINVEKQKLEDLKIELRNKNYSEDNSKYLDSINLERFKSSNKKISEVITTKINEAKNAISKFNLLKKELIISKNQISELMNNLNDLIKFEEIKALDEKIENLKSKLSLIQQKLEEKCETPENLISKVTLSQSEFTMLVKELDSLKLKTKDKIEYLRPYLKPYDELLNLLNNLVSYENNCKDNTHIESVKKLFKDIIELKELLNKQLSTILKSSREKVEDYIIKINEYQHKFNTIKKIFSEDLKDLIEFIKLSNFDDKKTWVLNNGYISWLFDDEVVKKCFQFFDEIENINILRFGILSSNGQSVNKLLKLFPDENNKDSFFSLIIEDMSVKEVIELMNELILSKKFEAGKKKIQKGLNESNEDDLKIKIVIEEFTSISNKLKKG